MSLHDVFVDLDDLLSFDFYPTSAELAHARFTNLLKAAEFDVSPLSLDDLDISELVDSKNSTFQQAVERNDRHFLMLAALWALACEGKPNAVQTFLSKMTSYIRHLTLAQSSEGLETEFIFPVKAAWRAHAAGSLWERHSVRKWLAKAGGRRNQGDASWSEDDEDDSLRVLVVSAIGDPESSQGKELKRRYGAIIGRPFPVRVVTADIEDVERKLLERFPWGQKAIEAILGPVRLQLTYGDPRRAGVTGPILLVGPPGSGKSHLLATAAELLGLPAFALPVGGTGDSGGLLPTSRGWSSLRPSGPFDAMHGGGCANPVIILDELDKASQAHETHNGNVHGTLLSMLNGDGKYYDSCLLANTDLRTVNFWATANSLASLRGPLLDRFATVELQSPRHEHFDAILDSVLISTQRSVHLRPEMVPELPVIIREQMRNEFRASNGSIRRVEAAYRSWLIRQTRVHRTRPAMNA